MERFLEKFNLLRLNQEEIEIMNKPITRTEIETVIKNHPPPPKKTKSTGPDGFTGEFCQTFREELMPVFSNPAKNLQRKEHFQTHSLRPPSPLIPKPDKNITKKK